MTVGKCVILRVDIFLSYYGSNVIRTAFPEIHNLVTNTIPHRSVLRVSLSRMFPGCLLGLRMLEADRIRLKKQFCPLPQSKSSKASRSINQSKMPAIMADRIKPILWEAQVERVQRRCSINLGVTEHHLQTCITQLVARCNPVPHHPWDHTRGWGALLATTRLICLLMVGSTILPRRRVLQFKLLPRTKVQMALICSFFIYQIISPIWTCTNFFARTEICSVSG